MSDYLRQCERERKLEKIRGKVRRAPRSPALAYPAADPPQYGDTDYKARGGRMVAMAPAEYIALAPPLEQDEETIENVQILSEHIRSGRELDPPMLRYDAQGAVVDHDGRHRAHASLELGLRKIPVLVYRE